MNDDIKSDLFLKLDALGDLFLVELNVLFLCDVALLKVLSVLSYVRCLRERTDGCCRKQRELQDLFLDLFTLLENRKSYIISISDCSDLSLNILVLTVDSAFEESLVLLEGFLICKVLACKSCDLINLCEFLFCECEMLLVIVS